MIIRETLTALPCGAPRSTHLAFILMMPSVGSQFLLRGDKEAYTPVWRRFMIGYSNSPKRGLCGAPPGRIGAGTGSLYARQIKGICTAALIAGWVPPTLRTMLEAEAEKNDAEIGLI